MANDTKETSVVDLTLILWLGLEPTTSLFRAEFASHSERKETSADVLLPAQRLGFEREARDLVD